MTYDKKKKILMNIKELQVPNITGVTYMSGRRRIWLNTLKMKQKIDYTTEILVILQATSKCLR